MTRLEAAPRPEDGAGSHEEQMVSQCEDGRALPGGRPIRSAEESGCLTVATALAVLLAGSVAAATVPFVTLTQGSHSDIREPREVVVRSLTAWETLWAAHSRDPLPAVDLSTSFVVGVFLGTRPTAGYVTEIIAVRLDADRAIVEYVERPPAPDALVAQVLTAPFHLVTVPREVRTVEFSKRGG